MYRLAASFFMSLHIVFFKKSRLLNEGAQSILGDLFWVQMIAATIPLFLYYFDQMIEILNDNVRKNPLWETKSLTMQSSLPSAPVVSYNLFFSHWPMPVSFKETCFHLVHHADIYWLLVAKILLGICALMSWHGALAMHSVAQVMSYKLLKPFCISLLAIFLHKERVSFLYCLIFSSAFYVTLAINAKSFNPLFLLQDFEMLGLPFFSIVCAAMGEYFSHSLAKISFINQYLILFLFFILSGLSCLLLFLLVDFFSFDSQWLMVSALSSFWFQNKKWLFLAGFSLGLQLCCLWKSFAHLSLTLSGLISFSSYIFSVFFAQLLLGESVSAVSLAGAIALIALNFLLIFFHKIIELPAEK
jgi:drug/metabolite transporter (DMT)-like permease